MRVDDFDFELPPERIAQRPASPRDSARLLHVHADGLGDHGIRDLPNLLRRGDLLVFNDTRVIPARLSGKRGTASVSITLHLREAADTWRAFARPAKRLTRGDRIDFIGGLSAEAMEKADGGEVVLRFDRGGAELMAALERDGALPLPPYIRGGIADARDRADYQTMFARAEGAVAAPTAALHFTPALLDALNLAGIGTAFLTLHVGAGTFLPVKVDDTADHVMHAEWGLIDAVTAGHLNETRASGGRIVAVGTTSLRLLESAAAPDRRILPFEGETRLFVTPGYRFRAVDALMTNFHLPRSTLFMLVAAFAGLAPMRRAYAHAIEAGYRFYSYGDASLIERAERL